MRWHSLCDFIIAIQSMYNTVVFAECHRMDSIVLMHQLFVDNVALQIVMNNPTVIRPHEQSLVISIPQTPRRYLERFLTVILQHYREIRQDRNLQVVAISRVLENSLEVEHLHPRRSVRLVLILQQQEPLGTQIELYLLQLELETNVLDRSPTLNLKKLNIIQSLPPTNRHFHKQQGTSS